MTRVVDYFAGAGGFTLGADGRWRVSVVPYWSAVDGRRVVALQLALRLTRDHCRVGLL